MNRVYQPRSALWWVMLALGVVGYLSYVELMAARVNSAVLAGGMVVLLAPVLCGVVIWHCSQSRPLRPSVASVAFLLGACGATWVAMQGNQAFGFLYYVIPNHAEDWQPAIAGPFTEEWAKSVLILLIAVLCGLRHPVQGFCIGACVGLGFQTAENIFYVARGAVEDPNSDVEGALITAVLRLFTALASHWAFSAFAGVGVMLLLARRWLSGIALVFCGYFCHFLWNTPVEIGNGLGVLALKMLIVDGALFLLVRWMVRADVSQVAGEGRGRCAGDVVPG